MAERFTLREIPSFRPPPSLLERRGRVSHPPLPQWRRGGRQQPRAWPHYLLAFALDAGGGRMYAVPVDMALSATPPVAHIAVKGPDMTSCDWRRRHLLLAHIMPS